MGHIRAEWVEDAEPNKKAIPVWLKWGSIAVCLCCAVILGMVGLYHLTAPGESSTTNQPAHSVPSGHETVVSPEASSDNEETPMDSSSEQDNAETAPRFPNAPDSSIPLEEAAAYDKAAAQVFTEAVYGLQLEVPADFSDEVLCNPTDDTLFTLYDQVSQDALSLDTEDLGGEVWYLSAMTAADFTAEYGLSATEWPQDEFALNTILLGRDGDEMYLLSFPTDVRYGEDAESIRSYYRHSLYGFTMLSDFLERNGITQNPYWEASYRMRLCNLATDDFYRVEFGAGPTTSSEPLLTEAAAAIPNLSQYFHDSEEPAPSLSWEDLLVYRLLQTDFSAIPADSAEFQTQLSEILCGSSPERLAYLDEDTPYAQEVAMAIRLLHVLCHLPNPESICESTGWYVTADGDTWSLHAETTDHTFQVIAAVNSSDPLWE